MLLPKDKKLLENSNIPVAYCQLYAEACRGGGRKAVSQAQKPSKAEKTALSLPQNSELNAEAEISQAKSRSKPRARRIGFASRKTKSQKAVKNGSLKVVKSPVEIDESNKEFEDVESLSKSMDSFLFEDLIETNPPLKRNVDIPYPYDAFSFHRAKFQPNRFRTEPALPPESAGTLDFSIFLCEAEPREGNSFAFTQVRISRERAESERTDEKTEKGSGVPHFKGAGIGGRRPPLDTEPSECCCRVLQRTVPGLKAEAKFKKQLID
ncbi:unnamed protein product [Bursaphelenchus xylophilus]|uniref:(pine wood nematode) hypothetical protein n=1 Tax=Bursaphelenchus xylophilus TaxID=6326 RepID=A0A811LZP9_BURXY|nr:unnamed protein product [Bursaphelenchus xylophilus]CAG9126716.1 unnamed protein product [Bursaphelenchus xylophilus]